MPLTKFEKTFWCEEHKNYKDECRCNTEKTLNNWELRTIKGIARAYAWKYGVEAVDLEQELALRVVRHYATFQEYVHEGHQLGYRKYRKALRNHAVDYCKRTVAKRANKHSYADFVTDYTKEQVVGALPYMFDHIGSVEVLDAFDPALQTRWTTRQQGLVTRVWSEVDEVRILVVGLRRSYETLNQRQQQLIYLKYGEDRLYREIADILGSTEGAVRKATTVAVETLRERLGQFA